MNEIDRLTQLLAKLPGLGPRSARRAVLFLLKRRESYLQPLASALAAAQEISACSICGNLDGNDPCAICSDPGRDGTLLCIVEDVADLWAIERTKAYRGLYHVLGGTLSALDGVGPEDLDIEGLLHRAGVGGANPDRPGDRRTDLKEIIIALNATVEGQTTLHYLMDRLAPTGIAISRLAYGVPIGGELDYLDEGTLSAALKARRQL